MNFFSEIDNLSTEIKSSLVSEIELKKLIAKSKSFAQSYFPSDNKIFQLLDEIDTEPKCPYFPEMYKKETEEALIVCKQSLLNFLKVSKEEFNRLIIDKAFDIPIQTFHICDTQKETVRIAVIQFCYELTKSFPLIIENKEAVKAKVFSGLEIAKQESVNIACLPELCLCEEWVPEIEKKYSDIIVIGGGFYKDKKNICPIITKSDVEILPQSKITPAAPEDTEMWDIGMIPGDRINKYETRFGKFVILICRDFERFAHRFRESDIDFIFCPAFNDANDRFHTEANNHVTQTPSYILIANTGINGGSSIFAQMNKIYFNRLVGEGCRDDGDKTFKLCEAKKGKDEIIIADFNLHNKSIHLPTPSVSSKEERSVTRIKKLPIP